MSRYLFLVIPLLLAACGSGGGSSTPSTPAPSPPPPPPVVLHHYDGVVMVNECRGLLDAQSNTIVQYTPSTDTLVFQTVLGPVTATSSRRVWFGGKEYAISFAPASNILIMVDILTSNHAAAWTITLIASPG